MACLGTFLALNWVLICNFILHKGRAKKTKGEKERFALLGGPHYVLRTVWIFPIAPSCEVIYHIERAMEQIHTVSFCFVEAARGESNCMYSSVPLLQNAATRALFFRGTEAEKKWFQTSNTAALFSCSVLSLWRRTLFAQNVVVSGASTYTLLQQDCALCSMYLECSSSCRGEAHSLYNSCGPPFLFTGWQSGAQLLKGEQPGHSGSVLAAVAGEGPLAGPSCSVVRRCSQSCARPRVGALSGQPFAVESRGTRELHKEAHNLRFFKTH